MMIDEGAWSKHLKVVY